MAFRASVKKRAAGPQPIAPVERLASKNNQKLARLAGFRKRRCHGFPGDQPFINEVFREECQHSRALET